MALSPTPTLTPVDPLTPTFAPVPLTLTPTLAPVPDEPLLPVPEPVPAPTPALTPALTLALALPLPVPAPAPVPRLDEPPTPALTLEPEPELVPALILAPTFDPVGARVVLAKVLTPVDPVAPSEAPAPLPERPTVADPLVALLRLSSRVMPASLLLSEAVERLDAVLAIERLRLPFERAALSALDVLVAWEPLRPRLRPCEPVTVPLAAALFDAELDSDRLLLLPDREALSAFDALVVLEPLTVALRPREPETVAPTAALFDAEPVTARLLLARDLEAFTSPEAFAALFAATFADLPATVPLALVALDVALVTFAEV